MRLKRLEIKGFKSFADKTIINFDENVTGVVGPNGCGKSNIVDSIRWVIGEQKISHLRSENLESLVFNGSKTRSASGLAEVSLTFENTKNLLPTEFSSVCITRKYYKSGESEYRLNDVPCRLKDIQNLFMDTGVSTYSYAIIELGMVNDLILDKDNSRRRMLEQAAGISIYKTRKKEAKLKLDATELDIARIEDLLFEINNQLKTLENQAKKAEKYYEIKKEYREVSIELAKASLEGFNVTYKNLNTQHDAEIDKRTKLEAEIAGDESGLEKERLIFIEKEKELQGLQQGFNSKLELLRTKENEKNLAIQRLLHLKEKETSLFEFLQKAEGQVQGIEESISFTHSQLEEEQKQLTILDTQLVQLREDVDAKRIVMDEKRIALDNLRSGYQLVQRSQFDAEKKVAVADTSILNYSKLIEQLDAEKLQREMLQTQIAGDLKLHSEELEIKKTDLEQLQQYHENTKEQILQTQAELENLRSKLADENRKLDAKKNEFELLKSLIDSMEGYPESVKFLHNNSGWNHTTPILSDIIYVKEEYRTALETVLDPYLNYYVVNDLQEGLQAVRLLDENKKGKANFFLLNKLNEFSSSVDNNSVLAGAISAMNVIEVDEKYISLAKYLLANVFIAENEDALQNSNGFVVIEKNGKYVKGKYSLTGGSVGLFEGKKIGRVKNLEKLQDEIADQNKIVESLKAVIQERQNEVIAFNEELRESTIKATETEIQKLTNQVFSFQNKLENLHSLETQGLQRLTDLNSQLQQTQLSVAHVRQELGGLSIQLTEQSNLLSQGEEIFKKEEIGYNYSSGQYNEFNLQVSKQQSKIVALQQEREFKTNQLTDLKKQLEESTLQLSETRNSITLSNEMLQQVEVNLIVMLKEKEEEEKKLNESDQAYYNLRNWLSEKESLVRHKIKDKELVEHLLSEIKDQLNELKLQLSGVKERLLLEFRIHLEDILEEPRSGSVPLEELQEKSDRMKKRMDNLGEVNPSAIEAYQEMKSRYEFILEQKTDLTTAKDSLVQTIEAVEATANQKFLEVFHLVRENFQKVFKALFTEDDQCDLILENPENLAETGIDVIAKPKGKRPTSLIQLSGGERAMTAIALLFSIYLIKPAPFCILDEVDAPLDDANVGKFTNMIRQFSDNSQFIIITHNKMTMSTVDVIYGVTMQEYGVSKLVNVDFRSLN